MNTMNQLLVTLIIILLPGILATVICDKIIVHSKWTSFKFSLYSLILGIFTYSILQILVFINDLISARSISVEKWSYLNIWDFVISNNQSVPAVEVTIATALSLPIALFAALAINHKLFNKLAQALYISTKYGDENLYSYYLNAKEIDWIYIRDIHNNLTYQGRVVSYSENEKIQEIVLSEVTVFRYEDSAELYSVPTIYLNKEMGGFIIEAIPTDLFGGNHVKETTD